MRYIAVVLGCATALLLVTAEPPVDPQLSEGASTQHGSPSGGAHRHPPSPQYGAPNRGYGGDEEPANYKFRYDVDAPEYQVKFGHQEARQGDVAQGKYYVLLPDGRTQVVEYTADQDGYHPRITYEGTANGGGYGRGPSQGGYN